MKYWLMKSEPSVFSFDDLVKAPKRTTSWEGVRNYQARNLMRDEMKPGDKVLFYHSNAEPTGVAGLAEVVRAAQPDLTALDAKSPYFDEKAKAKGESPWVLVDVRATHRFKSTVTREMLKNEARLKSMMVLKKGARLSVQPVTEAEFKIISRLGSASPI